MATVHANPWQHEVVYTSNHSQCCPCTVAPTTGQATQSVAAPLSTALNSGNTAAGADAIKATTTQQDAIAAANAASQQAGKGAPPMICRCTSFAPSEPAEHTQYKSLSTQQRSLFPCLQSLEVVLCVPINPARHQYIIFITAGLTSKPAKEALKAPVTNNFLASLNSAGASNPNAAALTVAQLASAI